MYNKEEIILMIKSRKKAYCIYKSSQSLSDFINDQKACVEARILVSSARKQSWISCAHFQHVETHEKYHEKQFLASYLSSKIKHVFISDPLLTSETLANHYPSFSSNSIPNYNDAFLLHKLQNESLSP